MKLWLDGDLVDAARARVSPFDHGLLVGDGVFETIRVYDGVPFAWSRHLARLARSAAGLRLDHPPASALRAAADAVLTANDLRDARLRITVTGGPAPLGSERGDGGPTVLVAAAPLGPSPATAPVVVVPWCRNERGATTGMKTISYADNVRALAYAHERGASEAVFPNTRDELCEGTGSNVFVVTGGTVRTPPERSGCLLGVSRGLVLEVCARAGIPCEETTLPIDALRTAEEAFLTSTTREVQPIAAVDHDPLSAPGPVTEHVQELFADLVGTDQDP